MLTVGRYKREYPTVEEVRSMRVSGPDMLILYVVVSGLDIVCRDLGA